MNRRTPKTYILVLNWNGWRDTLDCLESLYCNDCPDCQVVLIDNDSADDSLEKIRAWANGDAISSATNPFKKSPLPFIEYDRETAEQGGLAVEEERLRANLPATVPHPLVIVRTGENLGFAGGNNVGLRYSQHHGAGYVLLLNNDASLRSRDAVTTMITFMETHPDAGACGGRLFYPDGSAQASYGNFPSLSRAIAYLFPVYKLLPERLLRSLKRSNVVPDDSISEPLPVDYPSGACFLVRQETVDDVGLLDERFFMYAEETDWCLRMMKQGWGRYYLPRAEIMHKYAGSFRQSGLKVNCYFIESLFRYYRKNFAAWRLWILVLGYLLRSSWSIVQWHIAACLMPQTLRLKARENIEQWQTSLNLAVTTIRDLITGNIGKEQEQRPGRDAR